MAPVENRSTRGRTEIAVAVAALLLFSAGGFALQYTRAVASRPTTAERIYATMTEWGVDTGGLATPTDATEIDRRVEQLRSGMSEERVEAARWLSSRGISRAGDEIAASMSDTGTFRPCQLAHSLGRLGDDRWVGSLLDAADQTGNRDLRSCAAIGLSHIASSRSVEGLIEITCEDPSRLFAIEALGKTGDPRAIEHLRWLRERATSASQRRAIRTAIGRVEILSQPDPVPTLLRRVTRSAQEKRIDTWALRHIARRADERCVARLIGLFEDPDRTRASRELLAAALLAHGAEGRLALRQVSRDPEASEIAMIALSLSSNNGL